MSTTITHPLTGHPLPLLLNCKEAAAVTGESRALIQQMCEDGDIEVAVDHERFHSWRIYTIPLLRKFGLLSDTFSTTGGESMTDASASVATAIPSSGVVGSGPKASGRGPSGGAS